MIYEALRLLSKIMKFTMEALILKMTSRMFYSRTKAQLFELACNLMVTKKTSLVETLPLLRLPQSQQNLAFITQMEMRESLET